MRTPHPVGRTSARLMVAGALFVWAFYASLFIARSPSGAFNHDLRGHLEHTRILYNERRLAFPREGWETYQPPLYYLLNASLSPNVPSHIFKVRLLSVFYGALTLLCMSGMLTEYHLTLETQAVALGFIATTPAFLFMFTTYNNDSLATLLSIGILVAAYKWIRHQRPWLLALVGFLAATGLYTKLTVVYPLTALSLVVGMLALRKKLSWTIAVPLAGVLLLSGLLLTPWLIGHNYRLTHHFTPAPADMPFSDELHMKASPLRIILTPPGLTKGEWGDPYVHLWEPTHNKKNSYLAYLFSSSVFGEYTFNFLPPVIPWAIIILHGFLWIICLSRARQSPMGLLSLSIIVLGIVLYPTLFYRAPYSTQLDYRYIAWIWLPWAVLYAFNISSVHASRKTSILVNGLRIAMMAGIVLQGSVWLVLVVNGRWTIP